MIHLGPWIPDPERDVAPAWTIGRARLDLETGDPVLYSGHIDGVPSWGSLGRSGLGDTPGTEADADAWARSQGMILSDALDPQPPSTFDLIAHLHRQRAFSERTFGPGARTAGVLDHIRRELDEVAAAPDDVTEWIDVVLLAFDGAWRAGHSPEAIAEALAAKQARNEARTWPDWRTADPNKAITHVKEKTP